MSFRSKFARGSLRGFVALGFIKFAVVGVFIFLGFGPTGSIAGGALSGTIGPGNTRDWSFAVSAKMLSSKHGPGIRIP